MQIITENITIEAERLALTNQRAIYWEHEDALILSDLHIGKTAHFRKHGIPMPDDILVKDLERLETLIHYFKVSKLIIVGDLFHAEANSNLQTFKSWLNAFKQLKIILVRGNHDRQSKNLMSDLRIEEVTELHMKPFLFVHDSSAETSEYFMISGHIHPGILIKGKGRQKVKLPCYQVTSRYLVLPAFSLFTGLNTHESPEDAISYAFTESTIFKFD
ncbi:ligase-associated DNA damage response endonuclease PdeM [Winogradskyella sp.]|uniref:ligase-associated DNA damage response endonuclease PdeM n=1 Tax=Winogradskyella sp. TaxID=1883156 RepID=UPI003BAD7D59